ncbi:hypothetical protein [Lederbergia citrea]|uniref:Uncharacterized protein n=1 Tax=Lederbergia citrea TaxID=2833581 RepID=A0A942Z465_9BACI|nr:hypothetical protein [Lederbergia citrea]MBS4205377.1 hypothetical protein [Lederbergia citrea]MBS4224308.1 hypothetical protein [Lederbergia citrea]
MWKSSGSVINTAVDYVYKAVEKLDGSQQISINNYHENKNLKMIQTMARTGERSHRDISTKSGA